MKPFDTISQSLKVSKAHDVVLFIVQVFLIVVLVCVCLVNLTLGIGNQNLWIVILTGSLGYIMPNPKLKAIIPDGVTSVKSAVID
jgi:hypothetical protein